MTAPPSDATQPQAPSHEIYLKYLDKEMAIMGILSVFTAVTPALALDRTLAAAKDSAGVALWAVASTPILIGSTALLLAAAFFYRQRSNLAYYYGQIALSLTPSAYGEYSTKNFVHEADLLTSWTPYFAAFFLTSYGFLAYGVAVGLGGKWLRPDLAPRVLLWSAAVLGVSYAVHARVMWRFKNEYDPWRKAWEALWRASPEKADAR
jgi:hypothetical protein